MRITIWVISNRMKYWNFNFNCCTGLSSSTSATLGEKHKSISLSVVMPIFHFWRWKQQYLWGKCTVWDSRQVRGCRRKEEWTWRCSNTKYLGLERREKRPPVKLSRSSAGWGFPQLCPLIKARPGSSREKREEDRENNRRRNDQNCSNFDLKKNRAPRSSMNTTKIS